MRPIWVDCQHIYQHITIVLKLKLAIKVIYTHNLFTLVSKNTNETKTGKNKNAK